MLGAQPGIPWEGWVSRPSWLKDRLNRDKFYLLHIKGDAAELLPADDVRGLGTYATSDKLQEQFGADCTVISIGQAGEYPDAGRRYLPHRRT